MTIHKISVVTVGKDWQHWVEKLVWIFFLRKKGTRVTSQNHDYAQCAPQAPLNKATASGASPSAPATACIALGAATSDVANARAHETEIMRAHRRLQARKAGFANAGGSSQARELGKLSTNWIASELHLPRFQGHDDEATPIALQQLCVFGFFVRPGPFASATVHSGPKITFDTLAPPLRHK